MHLPSMASSPPPPPFLPLLLFVFLTPSFSSSTPSGIRTHLTHVDSAGNFTKLQILHRSLRRAEQRISRLTSSSSSSNDVQAPVHSGEGEFLMDLAIGTPSVPFPAIVDTGSDLIWTQCKPCDECFQQPTPIFDPSSSSTFSKLPCTSPLCKALPSSDCDEGPPGCKYTYSYGDSSVTQGVLASETLTFSGDASVHGIGFGCGRDNAGGGFQQAAGLVGLGRGPLSLVSQLGFGKFSYCLTTIGENKKSPLLFGSLATMEEDGGSAVKTTPLLTNPSQPTFYYLPLVGISVGKTRLPVPSSTFAINDDGTGGVIIDSGTSITYLEVEAYREVRKAFVSQMNLPVADESASAAIGLDLCFAVPKTSAAGSAEVEVPELVLHLEGADLELPAANYVVVDEGSGLLCLTIMGSRGMSIVGNFQQQNMRVLYDLEKGKMSFAHAKCNQK